MNVDFFAGVHAARAFQFRRRTVLGLNLEEVELGLGQGSDPGLVRDGEKSEQITIIIKTFRAAVLLTAPRFGFFTFAFRHFFARLALLDHSFSSFFVTFSDFFEFFIDFVHFYCSATRGRIGQKNFEKKVEKTPEND